MYRIEIYLEKSAGAAGDLGAAANRFSEHMRGTGKANMPGAYVKHRGVADEMAFRNTAATHALVSSPRFLEAQKTFTPKNRAQALGAGLSDAADRVIGAPRKMLNNANFGRNPFSGV